MRDPALSAGVALDLVGLLEGRAVDPFISGWLIPPVARNWIEAR